MQTITIKTSRRTEFLDITHHIQQEVTKRKLKEGIITVFIPHTTAGVMIQENADPDVMHDMEIVLDRMAPWNDARYRHAEGNTAAHVKAACVGTSAQVIVQDGQLQLGTWQGIYFCEFDGPRSRHVWIQ